MSAMKEEPYKYQVTNISDEIHMMEDEDRTRRFNPGDSKKTVSKPDGRETWYEIETIHPEAEDIENTADLPEQEEDRED